MKIRESDMPDEALWETFFDADCALKRLQCEEPCRNVVEFGCG